MRHKLLFVSILFILGLLILPGVSELVMAEPQTRDQKSSQNIELNNFFAKLKRARNEAEARAVEVEIWEHWSKSGVVKIDNLMGQARVLVSRGYLEPSLGLLDRVVYESPDFVDGWNRRATVLFLMKRDKESLADIAKVLALEPRHFGALAGKVMILMRDEKWHKALTALRRAVKIHPFLRERHLIRVLEKKLDLRRL